MYKGYEIFDRKCVERCSAGIYANRNGEKQCLNKCTPPLIGLPQDDQLLCVASCGDGYAVDKSDDGLWKCDPTCDFVTTASEEQECASPCPDSRPYRQPLSLLSDTAPEVERAECRTDCTLKMFALVGDVRTCVICAETQILVAQADHQYECADTCAGFRRALSMLLPNRTN